MDLSQLANGNPTWYTALTCEQTLTNINNCVIDLTKCTMDGTKNNLPKCGPPLDPLKPTRFSTFKDGINFSFYFFYSTAPSNAFNPTTYNGGTTTYNGGTTTNNGVTSAYTPAGVLMIRNAPLGSNYIFQVRKAGAASDSSFGKTDNGFGFAVSVDQQVEFINPSAISDSCLTKDGLKDGISDIHVFSLRQGSTNPTYTGSKDRRTLARLAPARTI